MSTLKQLIYNVKNLNGKHTDDYSMTDRQLEFIFNHFRAEVASQRVNSKKSIDGFTQEIPAVQLLKTSDFRPRRNDVYILKSKDPLPNIVTSHRGDIIDYVGVRDEYLGFQKSSLQTFNLDMENDFVSEAYFTTQGHLYIVSKNRRMLKSVYMSAVFGDPRAYMDYMGMDTSGDFEYPVPSNLIGQVNNLVINNEYRWGKMILPDLINDGQDAKQQGN